MRYLVFSQFVCYDLSDKFYHSIYMLNPNVNVFHLLLIDVIIYYEFYHNINLRISLD